MHVVHVHPALSHPFHSLHHMNDDDDDMIVIIKLSLKQDTLPGLPIVSCDRAVLVNSTQLKEEEVRKTGKGREGKGKCRTCSHLRETPFVFRFSLRFWDPNDELNRLVPR